MLTDVGCEVLLQQLSARLLAQEKMLVTAESCTGGGIAYCVTELPGSSQWFERGFVTYSNRAKQEQLGVAAALLDRFGAVSEEVAAAMAQGALQHSHADLSVAVTGIAGPGGGTADKPVGCVCFGWGLRGGDIRTARVALAGARRQVRTAAVLEALRGAVELLESS